MRKALQLALVAFLLVGLTSVASFAGTNTPCIPQIAKADMLTAYAAAHTPYMILGYAANGTGTGPYLPTNGVYSTNASTASATLGEPTTAYGYQIGGIALSTLSCTVSVYNTGNYAADYNCATAAVWTVSGGGSIGPIDSVAIVDHVSPYHYMSIYTLASPVTATGTGATLTINFPTSSNSVAGAIRVL